jgi:hypothetical protein
VHQMSLLFYPFSFLKSLLDVSHNFIYEFCHSRDNVIRRCLMSFINVRVVVVPLFKVHLL